MTRLRLDGVSKHFGSVRAVDDVSLAVADGSLVALVGPSGCGKTTLLRLIAGLDECDQGEIWFDDRRVDGHRAADRDVAMVFQDAALYPHLDVAENLTVPLRLRGVRRRERRRRAAEVAGRLGLTEALDRRPAQLSGGQRQRVAVGRAVLRDPQLLLLDEPLSNLDAGRRSEVRDEIRSVQRELGVTAVLVTHDQAEALAIADLVVVMLDGRVVQVGTPEELYTTPRSIDCARMIGDAPMNLRPGVLDRRSDGATVLTVDGVRRVWPDSEPPSGGERRELVAEAGVETGIEVVVGVRSCDLTPVDAGAEPCGTWSWSGTVTAIEFQGSRTLLSLDLDGRPASPLGTEAGASPGCPFRVMVNGTSRHRIGDRCSAAAPSDALHVFDAASGRRMWLEWGAPHDLEPRARGAARAGRH